ncbi:MAG: aspartate kinase [Planctomycetota bacterium]|nr:MAG: aspartate kinase [Planctomycetota bacterium]
MVIVMKFGGSSVADSTCMRHVLELVREALPRGPLVVLSAMGKTTDALFRAARLAERGHLEEALAESRALYAKHRTAAEELLPRGLPVDLVALLEQQREELDLLLRGVALLRELSPRSMDAIASQGERLSTLLFSRYVAEADVSGELFDARNAVRTDGAFGSAQPDLEEIRALASEHLKPLVGPGRCVVTQGYIGSTVQGFTTTLGRGGSDYSASLLGAALGAEEVQIWTDVEGVLTADPRVIPAAQPIAELSFAEAAELAAFGAKVLHPATIQPAIDADIPVTVRHTMRPNGRFTLIRSQRAAELAPKPAAPRRPITALASRGPITVLTLTSTRMFHQSGYLARVFDVFGRMGVSVDLVATAEVSVSCTIEADAPIEALVRELSRFATIEVAQQRAIVAVVGARMKDTPGLVSRIFGALGDIAPELVSLGGNEINLSLVVPKDAAAEALRRLHRAFFEGSAA